MRNSIYRWTSLFRKWNKPVLAIAAVLGLAMCCLPAVAQSGAGSIQGTVTDSTGAVIPGATIKVVNLATNVATTTKSNNVGFASKSIQSGAADAAPFETGRGHAQQG